MRLLKIVWLVLATLVVATACGPVVVQQLRQDRPEVRAEVVLPHSFGTQAVNKTVGDIHHYVYSLYNVANASLSGTTQTIATTIGFPAVADGTYRLRAEAFDAASVSLTQGGPQLSANTVTVAGTSNFYNSGGLLSVTLNLFNATGETIPNGITVAPGGPYLGSASGVNWQPGVSLASTAVGTAPDALAIDSVGNAWVANDQSGNLTKLSPAGAVLGTFVAGTNPFAVTADSVGAVWVVDRTGNKVLRYDSAGTLLGSVAVAADPRGVAIDPSGRAWVTSNATTAVTVVTPGLSVAATYPVGFASYGVAVDKAGNVWLACKASGNVIKLSPSGSVLATVAVGGAPEGVTVDALGNAWVANRTANQVQRVTPAGAVAGTYAVTSPEAIALDFDGNVVVACNDGNLQVLSNAGAPLSTYAVGTNLAHVAIDAANCAWVADRTANVARKVSL